MIRLLCFLLMGAGIMISTGGSLTAQTLGVTNEQNFRRCTEGDNKEFKVKVTNISDRTGFRGNSFSLDWGDGSEGLRNVSYDELNVAHTYASWGVFELKITATLNSGGTKEQTYRVVNLSRPAVGLEEGQTGISCINTLVEIAVTNYSENSDSTVYTMDFGDGNKNTYKQEDLVLNNGKITHKYTKTHCDLGFPEGITIRLTARNECGYDKPMDSPGHFIIRPPKVEFVALPKPGCTGREVQLLNNSDGGLGKDCQPLTDLIYEWDFGEEGVGAGQENAKSPVVTYEKKGTYPITLTIKSDAFTCARDTKTVDLKIIESVKAGFDIPRDKGCDPLNGLLFTNSSSGDERKYDWQVSGMGITGGATLQTQRSEANARVDFKYGDYLVTQTVSNSCSFDTKDTIIKVSKDPEVARLDPLLPVCPGTIVKLAQYVSYNWYNNEHLPEWKIDPATGWEPALGTTLVSEYPQIRFTAPGNYTLTVTLKTAGCGGDKLTKTQTLHVYDPEIKMDQLVADKTEMCEGQTVTINGSAQGEIEETLWSVTWAGGLETGITPVVSEGKARVTIPDFGKYRITARANGKGGCNWEEKSFDVTVLRAPEVSLSDLPAYWCPGGEFYPGGWASLNKNGNPAVGMHWSVWIDGNPAGDDRVIITGADSENPKLKFNIYGDYEIRVTVDNPTGGCGPLEKLQASKTLHVVNPELTVNIQADQEEFCMGGTLGFTNTTHVEEGNPEYYWSVTPGTENVDYEFAGGTNATSPTPKIRFLKSGRYTANVNVSLYEGCSHELKSFPVTVKEDPSMVIDPLGEICPGELLLDESLVHYSWNDEWNGGVDGLRKVEWSLADKPDGAVFTPYESPEWNKRYPVIQLKTPGHYVLQARLISMAGCSSTLIFQQSVEVYDPAVQVRIEPVVNTETKKLQGNTYQALQRKEVSFTNTTTGVGLDYTWSVSPENGVSISDVKAAEPKITFNEHGTFRVKVHTEGTCNKSVPDQEFVFVVMGVPTFVLNPLPDHCDSDDWILDLKQYLVCDSAGNDRIDCSWAISPVAGTILEGGTTTSDMFMQLRFIQNGIYTLKLTAEATYGGPQVVSGQIRILKHEVTAKAELAREGCTTDAADGMEVFLANKSEGDSLRYTWRILPESGWTGDLNKVEPTVRFTQQGNYQVFLKAENICQQPEVSYDFRAYAKPEVVQSDGPDLGRWCMRDAMFEGEVHVGEIRENNDEVTARWEISPGGYQFVNSAASSRKPDVKFTEGDRTFHLTGKYFNHCKDTALVEFEVWIDSLKTVNLFTQDPLCAMTGPVELKATPLNGVWSAKPGFESMLEEVDGKYYFRPNRNEDLTVRAYYEYGHGTCISRDSIEISVRQLPDVDAGRDTVYCLNEGVQELIGVTPPDLTTWQGNGVVDQKYFDPEVAGPGITRLEYHVVDPATHCPNLDTLFVTVHGLPDPRFEVSASQCSGIDSLFVPVELGVGNLFTWHFGNGDMLETEDEPAHYAYPQHGFYQVYLVATSPVHCSDTSENMTVKVLDPPPTAEFTVADTAGCGPFTTKAEIRPEHFAGEYYNLQYWWDYGNGNTSALLEPEEQVYQPTLFDTTYQMIFKVYNGCGEQLDTVKIGAWSKAVANFAMNPEEEGCTPAEIIFMNKSTGSHNSYSWDFGDKSNSSETDPVHIFTTSNNMSVFEIKLTATNRCMPDGSFFGRSLKVKPNSIVAGFTKSGKYLCAGDTVCFENHSVDRDPSAALNYSWDFGDGQVAAVWDTCHQYVAPGTYQVSLKIDNGCAHREFKDSVIVHVLPVLHLEGEDALCEDLELKLTVSSEEPLKNIIWDFGDGVSLENGAFQVMHAFEEPGTYQVKVRGEGNQIPSCPGEEVKTVEVWSKPRVKILPLDTMVCPPFLYRPEVVATSYDYFTWDYGDGTPLTSSMEHLYTNDSGFIRSFTIRAYVENNYGCKEEHPGLIRIYNGPKANWDKEIAYGRPEKVRFINLSRDYSEAIWYLPFDQIVNSPEDQVVVFNEEGIFPVALTVINQYGCRDSLYMDYRSYEGGLYFPNSFIPHSTNARVNRFNGIGMGLKEYKLEIFDMYGNKVWETTALEGGMPSEGWDGKNRDGKLLPQGVYVWRAEAVFFSEDVWTGDNNRSGKSQTTQGTVLMLRK